MAGRNGRNGPGPAVPSTPSKPCFEFERNGRCKFGPRCKYSHDAAGTRKAYVIRTNAGSAQSGPRTPKPREGKLMEWKRLCHSSSPLKPTQSAVSRFLQLALEIMDGDVGGAQEMIKILATDPGLHFVRTLTDDHIPMAKGPLTLSTLWETEVKPLFTLVTNARLVNSSVLEGQAATIFNFLIGVGGTRMTKIFGYITRLVQSPSTPSANGVSQIQMQAIELSLAVISKILDYNTTSIIQPGFVKIISDLSGILKRDPLPEGEFSHLQATKYMDYIKQRLEVGEAISDKETAAKIPVSRESFVLRRDLPGNLSADGPRHNNDHADISKIKIMPTKEEIMSPRAEYLPTTDQSQWHVKGIRGRLDREFRLIREDTIGQLRDAVREKMEQIRNPREKGKPGPKESLRTNTYDFPEIIKVELSDFDGMEMLIQCHQPLAVKNLTAQKRKDWWERSKKLQSGALVCVIDVTGSAMFFTISDSTLRSQDDRNTRKFPKKTQSDSNEEDKSAPLTLSDDANYLFVRLQLVDPGRHEISDTLHWYQNAGKVKRRYLVEFPGVLLPSFKHTLDALKHMYERPNIPFAHIIAPDDPSAKLEINPPQYSRKTDFVFGLDCLNKKRKGLVMVPRMPVSADALTSQTTLDPTQSAALLNTLLREFALIQGPPGTGKSYTGEKIIQVLLENRKKADLGPIVCVCYTNHALDQLLEHLLDDGIKDIIRIGSRSKSERLEGLNLRTIAKQYARTKSEKTELYGSGETVRDLVREGNGLLRQLSASQSQNAVSDFLRSESPIQHREFFGTDTEGYEKVVHKPEKIIARWLAQGTLTMQHRQLADLQKVSVWSMSQLERNIIYRSWLKKIRDPIIAQLTRVHEKYRQASKQRDMIRGDIDLRCLEQAQVIGVTTTGLARNLEVLRKLESKVMLCEEAGEVQEAHILTALLPSLEHCILIGDHLQLRPQIQNYDLQSTNPRGEKYSLDVSLFERLVQPYDDEAGRVPYSVLETQRRMHPSISNLIRSTLYPALKDAEKVEGYPDVVGMKKRLFWLHHEQPEASAAGNDALGTSHSNDFEIEMTVALVSHLSRQGVYAQGDIAVITPYLGQLQRLRRRMESMFELCLNERDQEDLEALEADGDATSKPPGPATTKTTLLKSIRVATVDNFQGEEAKVIVISLVRSNPAQRCGFLRTSNRINVLLSRAQHGMYLIGDARTYTSVPMWSEVLGMLEREDNFGESLELQCPRHPDTPILVSKPDHFVQFSPESGCNMPCEKRLRCGHACSGRCHSDVLHRAVKCLQDCPRLKQGCDHACPLRCGDVCHDKCQVFLKGINLALACGHQVSSARCWEAQNPASIRCTKQVSKTVPGCEHTVKVPCYVDVSAGNYKCQSLCGHNLPCGHTCKSSCFKCNNRVDGQITERNHGICKQTCGRKSSTCPHSCDQDCHDGAPCKPCKRPCEVRCSHSKCDKPCHEPCAPCAASTCESSCPHSKCTMPCAAPCDWVPCSLRCEKMLECGHRCPSVCGEICPKPAYCQTCASPEIKSVCVDFLEMKEYHEMDLNEDPCIFPDCGHFLAVSSMDGRMDMSAHYKMDERGLPVGILSAEPFSMENIGVKTCPTCRGSLRSISRYGRTVRRALLDEATKKFVAWSQAAYNTLAGQLVEQTEILAGTRVAPLVPAPASAAKDGSHLLQLNTAVRAITCMVRHKSMRKYRNRILQYKIDVRKEEQPFQRVADLVTHANRQHGTNKEFRYDEQSVIQVKGSLLATCLLIKCDLAMMEDFLAARRKGFVPAATQVKIDLSAHMIECERFTHLANATKHALEETQGHIFHAKICYFWTSFGPLAVPPASPELAGEDSVVVSQHLKQRGLGHINQARDLLERYPSTSILKDEIDNLESALNGHVYHNVTAEELRQVYKASMTELMGTGHWYTCANGHPFTINNCGMPMEEARCPECNAAIGGRNHTAVAGVRHATEIEEIARGP